MRCHSKKSFNFHIKKEDGSVKLLLRLIKRAQVNTQLRFHLIFAPTQQVFASSFHHSFHVNRSVLSLPLPKGKKAKSLPLLAFLRDKSNVQGNTNMMTPYLPPAF